MSHHPLAGVVEKLRRSDEHLILLYHELRAYLEGTPYGLLPKRDPKTGQATLLFKVTKEPPPRFSTIIGDVLFNMRASLDYIVHELVIRNNRKPTFQTQFPFSDTGPGFQNEAFKKGRLDGVADKAIKVIDAMQPYQLGADYAHHPLWILHKLQNLDKHRRLNLSAFVGSKNTWVFINPDLRIKSFSNDKVIHDGDEVIRLPLGFSLDAKVQGRITGQVSFQDPPATDGEVGNALQGIREFIGQNCLSAIEPFFDPLPDSLRLTSHGIPLDLINKPKPLPETPILKPER